MRFTARTSRPLLARSQRQHRIGTKALARKSCCCKCPPNRESKDPFLPHTGLPVLDTSFRACQTSRKFLLTAKEVFFFHVHMRCFTIIVHYYISYRPKQHRVALNCLTVPGWDIRCISLSLLTIVNGKLSSVC